MSVYSHVFLAIILLARMDASPMHGTTESQVNSREISTTSKEIFEHTSVDSSFENQTTSNLNVTSAPIMANIGSFTSNSTVRSGTIQGKLVTYNTTTTYYGNYGTSSSDSGSGLSGGAIAGIVIGIVVLLCCCGCCAGATKSGHWEKVWVSH